MNDGQAIRNNARDETGYVSEVFCSIQGEGPFVGRRHIFLRTAGCSATCSWCDTVYSKMETPRCIIHRADGSKQVFDNPVDAGAIVDTVIDLSEGEGPVDSVSITGGEPLEQPEFVGFVARGLRSAGLDVYLETNGVHADAMSGVMRHVSVVAMDIKLPSAIGEEAWCEHETFLDRITRAAPDVRPYSFVKIVVDARSTPDEMARAISIIAGADPRIPLVLQPESEIMFSKKTNRTEKRALLKKLADFQRGALSSLDDVRVIPQCHKVMEIR